MDFGKFGNFFNSPAFLAMQKNQAVFSQINKMSSIVNPSSVQQAIKGIQKFDNSMLPFTQTMEALEKVSSSKTTLSQIPLLQNQFVEISNALRPAYSLSSAIESNSLVLRSLKMSGIFDGISVISKNMSAIQAITKLNALIPLVDPIDYDLSFTDEDNILINDIPVSRDDILEIAIEFNNLSLENLNEPNSIPKLKSIIGKLFLSFLGFVLFNLTVQPLFDNAFELAREIIGINKIYEKIDIKSWTEDKLFKSIDDDFSSNEEDTPTAMESGRQLCDDCGKWVSGNFIGTICKDCYDEKQEEEQNGN
jgi:hypothetical protein